MSASNGLNEKRIAANIKIIAARQNAKVLSSMEVVVRKATPDDLAAFERDAVRPMDRLLAQPIRCRDWRTE